MHSSTLKTYFFKLYSKVVDGRLSIFIIDMTGFKHTSYYSVIQTKVSQSGSLECTSGLTINTIQPTV